MTADLKAEVVDEIKTWAECTVNLHANVVDSTAMYAEKDDSGDHRLPE